MRKQQSGGMCLQLARVWCLAAKQAGADERITPAERASATKAALTSAVECLERGRAAGEFENPELLRWYAGNADFAAVRDRFDPQKK